MIIRLAQAADCAAIAQIQIDSYRTAYSPLMPAEYLAAFSYAEQEQDWKDLLARGGVGELLFVAEAEGQVCGYLLARQTARAATGFDGEVVALHVRPGAYRRGIGRALLGEAARRLHGLGCASLNLWVLEGNPARGFYEHLGGRPAGEQFFEIEELNLRRREVGYAWEDIRVLFEPEK